MDSIYVTVLNSVAVNLPAIVAWNMYFSSQFFKSVIFYSITYERRIESAYAAVVFVEVLYVYRIIKYHS